VQAFKQKSATALSLVRLAAAESTYLHTLQKNLTSMLIESRPVNLISMMVQSADWPGSQKKELLAVSKMAF